MIFALFSGPQADYRLVSMISAGFTCFSLLVLLPIPESPTWLVGKRRLSSAQKSLAVIRGTGELHGPNTNFSDRFHPENFTDKGDYRIEKEIKDLVENIAKSNTSGKKTSKWRDLRKPELYKPLSIMIAFFAFQQFSGIFVIFVYAAQFSKQAGVAIDPLLSAVYIGLTRVVTTLLMAYISDKFGRRPPAFFSGFGMCASMMGLAACSAHPLVDTSFNWVPAFLLIFFIFSCTLGFLTLPFAMIAELYPQRTRGFAAGLTICAGYFMSFINIKAYPYLVDSLGNEVIFIFYGTVSLLGIFFVYFVLPETKGKSLQEIENYFRGERKSETDIEMLPKS